MQNYSVFIRHRTGFSASMDMDADAAIEAVKKVQPLLGEGWNAVGALEKSPEPLRNDTSCILFGKRQIERREAPRYVHFNFEELTCFPFTAEHIHYVFLLKKKNVTENGWGYFLWEHDGPREKMLEWVEDSSRKESIYALYERCSDGQFKLIADFRPGKKKPKKIHRKKK